MLSTSIPTFDCKQPPSYICVSIIRACVTQSLEGKYKLSFDHHAYLSMTRDRCNSVTCIGDVIIFAYTTSWHINKSKPLASLFTFVKITTLLPFAQWTVCLFYEKPENNWTIKISHTLVCIWTWPESKDVIASCKHTQHRRMTWMGK